DRERRLVARFPPEPFDGVEERCLLAADVGARALAQLDVEGEPASHDVGTEQAAVARFANGALEARGGEGIFAAHVDEPPLAAGSEIERLAQRLVTAVRLVVVEAAGVDRAGSREQTQRRISALGNDRARSLERWRFAGEQRAGDLRSHRSDGALHGSRSRDGEKCGGRALAKTET